MQKNIRKDFPLLNKITYLDSAAAGLKPKQMINKISDFYSKYPFNPNSANTEMSFEIVKEIEKSREFIGEFIDAQKDEIIFTSGATQSLNHIAMMLEPLVKKGDEILISPFNHASNYMVWLKLAKKVKAKILSKIDILGSITKKTKIIAYSQQNNSFQFEIDTKKIYEKAKRNGAILINDAAQAVSHKKVSLKLADVIVFSGNKIFGPTGIGVLAIRKSLMDKLTPVYVGGASNISFNERDWKIKKGYYGFESGTKNTAGIIGLAESIKYFKKHFSKEKEKLLAEYTYDQLSSIKGIKIFSNRGDVIILFKYKHFHSHDVVSYLGKNKIILRAGKHCVKAVDADNDSCRISIAFYNNKKDIDKLIKVLKKGNNFVEI